MSDETQTPPTWLRPVADFGPLLLFFAAFKLYDLMTATAVIVVASLVALALTWFFERRIPVMPLVTAAVVTVFGGLTLWFNNDTFIKMKPTIVQAIFAVILLGGLAFRRPLLRPLLGKMMPPMTDAGWQGLTFRYGLFFVAMAVLNEVVWRTQTENFWVNFKVFGIMALTIGFILLQMPFMNRHMMQDDDPVTDSDD
ncbi:MAG: septation protein A [Geminicoccaceae bacterium]